jgi:hypothetical protein
MSIDLSFTQNIEWIKERELHWKSIGKGLKGDFKKQEIADIKKFFMSGEEGASYQMSDGAFFVYYPLQSPEGWDYILRSKVKDQSEFRHLFNETLQDRSSVEFFPYMAPYELARWDYFLGETFEPTITSRVPIAGEKVTLELDPYDVFYRIGVRIWEYVEDGFYNGDSKWLQRINYFWSLWPHVSDDAFSSEQSNESMTDAIKIINYLLPHIVEFKPYTVFDDPNQTRPKFLKMMEEKLDELYPQLCPKLQVLWNQTKAKKAALKK